MDVGKFSGHTHQCDHSKPVMKPDISLKAMDRHKAEYNGHSRQCAQNTVGNDEIDGAQRKRTHFADS